MALITSRKSEEKTKVKIELSKKTFEQVQAYCNWANIDSLDHFFEEAAQFIFAKDIDWKKHQKELDKIS